MTRNYFVVLILLITWACVAVLYRGGEPDCVCGWEGSSYDTEQESVLESVTGRKVRKVWFSGGAPGGLTQDEFQRRVMLALAEVSGFTNTDFVRTETKSGSYFQFYVLSDETMWRYMPAKYKAENKVYLEVQNGTWLGYTVRPRFGGERVLESATIHGLGHRLNIPHSSDQTSIMHADLPVRYPNAVDKERFQAKLGKVTR